MGSAAMTPEPQDFTFFLVTSNFVPDIVIIAYEILCVYRKYIL